MKNLLQLPFYLQVLLVPVMWIVALVKIMLIIPYFIVSKCNSVANQIFEYKK